MKNIIAAVKRNTKKELKYFLTDLKLFKTVKEIREDWRSRQYITPTYMKKKDLTIKDLKEYIKVRATKKYLSRIESEILRIEEISKAPKVKSIRISVEWKKNSTWGANPRAEVTVIHENNTLDVFESGSISGCGYDKESTAIAKALNQSTAVLKLLYSLKNKNIDKKNEDIFHYGIGGSETPRFSSGVGTDCYYRVFENLGFKMEKVASGNTFDAWTVTK